MLVRAPTLSASTTRACCKASIGDTRWSPAPGCLQRSMKPERASFDPPIATTPLEYPAWGAGLFTEPALKIDSPNGDRTLILKFASAQCRGPATRDRLERRGPTGHGASLLSRVSSRRNCPLVANREPGPNSVPHRTSDVRSLESPARHWLLPQLANWPMGCRMATPHGSARNRRPVAGVPSRQHLAPGESVVRHRPHRADHRNRRSGLVWRTRLEWKLAHGG